MSEEWLFGEVVDGNDEGEWKCHKDDDMSAVSPVTFAVLIIVERLLAVDIGDRLGCKLK